MTATSKPFRFPPTSTPTQTAMRHSMAYHGAVPIAVSGQADLIRERIDGRKGW